MPKLRKDFSSYLGKFSNPDAPIMSEFWELALHSHGLYIGSLNAIFTIIISIVISYVASYSGYLEIQCYMPLKIMAIPGYRLHSLYLGSIKDTVASTTDNGA